MEKISGFTFYQSYYESLCDLEREDKLEMIEAIIDYVFADIDPNLTGFKKTIWTLIKPNLDTSKNRARNAKKTSENKNEIKNKSNENQNQFNDLKEKEIEEELELDKELDIDKEEINRIEIITTINKPKYDIDIYKRIIEYLNESINKSFRYNAEVNKKHITARLNDGYTENDFYAVIDKKVNDWLGDKKMREYLVPETLFGPKFEKYLNAPSREKSLKEVDVDISDMFDKKGV